jgi:formylglycine-generating enzyme required for sulfatase activity
MSFRDMIQKFPTPAGMVPIPAGSFRMGSNAGGAESDEKPVHEVTLTYSFWMGATPVTQEEFQALMGFNPSYHEGEKKSVEQVNWRVARAYCEALTRKQSGLGAIPAGYEYRLPTEAEWEYACRAGTTSEYNTGDVLLPSQACFDASVDDEVVEDYEALRPVPPVPVASYPPNAWGLYDMHGNVWEWCLDSFEDYPAGAVTDPFVTGGPYRVLRGGSWSNNSGLCRSAVRSSSLPGDSGICRSAIRGYIGPGYTSSDRGFRVVLAPVLVP